MRLKWLLGTVYRYYVRTISRHSVREPDYLIMIHDISSRPIEKTRINSPDRCREIARQSNKGMAWAALPR